MEREDVVRSTIENMIRFINRIENRIADMEKLSISLSLSLYVLYMIFNTTYMLDVLEH